MEHKKVCHLKFRSKTEAVWAALLAETGYSFQYEPVTHQTTAGPYCPDFFLPDFDLFLEAKADMPSEEERQKLIDVSIIRGCKVGFLIGTPKSNGENFYNSGMVIPSLDRFVSFDDINKISKDKNLPYIAQRAYQIGKSDDLQGYVGPKMIGHLNKPFLAIVPGRKDVIKHNDHEGDWVQIYLELCKRLCVNG